MLVPKRPRGIYRVNYAKNKVLASFNLTHQPYQDEGSKNERGNGAKNNVPKWELAAAPTPLSRAPPLPSSTGWDWIVIGRGLLQKINVVPAPRKPCHQPYPAVLRDEAEFHIDSFAK
jgi:hypothetical protein